MGFDAEVWNMVKKGRVSKLSVGGVPILGGGIPVTGGKTFFVNYTNGHDGPNLGKDIDEPFKTIEYAYTRMTTNKYDVCVLTGNATHPVSAMMNLDKNRCIFVGLDGANRRYGQGARITMALTTAVTDLGIIKNTGNRNAFYNIKFDSANSLTESVYGFMDGGEYTYMENCEFYKSTHLTAAAGGNLAAELLCNGDSSQYMNCTFGDLVNSRGTGGSCIRPTVLFTRETITGKVARDVTFSNCQFFVKACDTGVACLYASTATDIERRLIFERPTFMNAKLGTANPGEALLLGAAQTEGWVLMIEPTSMDITAHASASSGVYITGGSTPLDTTTGIAAIIDS